MEIIPPDLQLGAMILIVGHEGEGNQQQTQKQSRAKIIIMNGLL